MRSEFPHVSALRSKKKVQLAILVRFSDVHIYTYVYIYMTISQLILTVAIASLKFLNL